MGKAGFDGHFTNRHCGEVVPPGGGGGTLRISRLGCVAGTLEPLACTRAGFSWILLPYTRVSSWFP